jgi:hypothetical protein
MVQASGRLEPIEEQVKLRAAHMSKRPAGLIAATVVASLGGLASAIAGVDALANAASIHHTPGPTPISPVLEGVLGEALLAVTAVCAWLAVRLTRRLRRPAAGTDDSGVGADAIPLTPPTKVINLVLHLFLIVALTAVFVGFSTLAIAHHSDNDRSAYVQAHGLRRSAVVDRVQNSATTDKGVTTYTATLSVTVTFPASGDRNAVVYDPGRAQVKQGSTITVLLDPQQPAYAELPGHPDQGGVLPVFFSFIALLGGVMAVGLSLAFIAAIRRRPMLSLIPGRLARAYLMRKKSGPGRWPAIR